MTVGRRSHDVREPELVPAQPDGGLRTRASRVEWVTNRPRASGTLDLRDRATDAACRCAERDEGRVVEQTSRGEAGEPPTANDANTVPVAGGGDSGELTSPPAETLLKASATKSPAPATELLRADAGDVQATTVSMERSGADHVTGERVIMNRSGAKTLEARSAQLDRSGVVLLRSEHAVLQGGSALAVTASEVRMVKGKALLVRAAQASIEGDARVLIYAGAPSAEVRPVIDARGAAALGAGLGVVMFLLRSLRRRLS